MCYICANVGNNIVVGIHFLEKHNWLLKMLKICFLISLISLFSSVFYVFNEVVYQSWYYMSILLMVFATVLVLENSEQYKIIPFVLFFL